MKTIAVLAFVLAIAGTGVLAQDSLSSAKDLYASAAFEDALSTLTRIGGDGSITPDTARQVEQYRAFCLFALGRTAEAEAIAESIIRKNPLGTLDVADASPRLETMFSSVRKRLMPSLIRERFRTARTALDQKDLRSAEPQLVEARLMIAEAEKLGVKDDGLSDLSVLVDGFLQLARLTAEPRPLPQPVAPAPPVVAAVPASQAAPAGQAVPAGQVGPAPAPSATAAPRVYTVDDVSVTPPVVVRQQMPALRTDLVNITKAMKTTGLVEVLIDEKGDVINATIRRSLNSTVDDLILESARRWKYKPAVRDGVPVRYLKMILLLL